MGVVLRQVFGTLKDCFKVLDYIDYSRRHSRTRNETLETRRRDDWLRTLILVRGEDEGLFIFSTNRHRHTQDKGTWLNSRLLFTAVVCFLLLWGVSCLNLNGKVANGNCRDNHSLCHRLFGIQGTRCKYDDKQSKASYDEKSSRAERCEFALSSRTIMSHTQCCWTIYTSLLHCMKLRISTSSTEEPIVCYKFLKDYHDKFHSYFLPSGTFKNKAHSDSDPEQLTVWQKY